MGFFKAYDMRGTFGSDFDLDTVFRVGRELPGVIGAKKFLIGRDCRSTSPAIAAALKRGLADSGADVTDLGLATTPMVYFFTAEDDFDASVMITASHNPPTDNGLKVSKRGALPVGYESGLAEVIELKDRRWYIGTQYHPEYSSTVLNPHPLFMSFIEAIIAHKAQ